MEKVLSKKSAKDLLKESLRGQVRAGQKLYSHYAKEFNKVADQLNKAHISTTKLQAQLERFHRSLLIERLVNRAKENAQKLPCTGEEKARRDRLEAQITRRKITTDFYKECLQPIIRLLNKVIDDYRHLSVLFRNLDDTREGLVNLYNELNGMTLLELQNVIVPNFDWAKNNFHPHFFTITREEAELRASIFKKMKADEKKIKEMDAARAERIKNSANTDAGEPMPGPSTGICNVCMTSEQVEEPAGRGEKRKST